MKESIILETFLSNKGTIDSIKPTDEYRRLQTKFTDLHSALTKKLSNLPNLLELFEQVCKAETDLSLHLQFEYYVQGYKNGFITAQEIFKE